MQTEEWDGGEKKKKRHPSHLWFQPALLQTVLFHRSTLLTGFLITTVSYREEPLVSGRNDQSLFKHETIKRKAMQRSWKANQSWWNISNNAVKEKACIWENGSGPMSGQNNKCINVWNKFMLGECTAANRLRSILCFCYMQTAPSLNLSRGQLRYKNSTHMWELISKGIVSIHSWWRC